MSRPEQQAPPEVFYSRIESQKYTFNSRIITVQSQLTLRALELLQLPSRPCFLLDLGCGSGLSGSILSMYGHEWVGMDISEEMLHIANQGECLKERREQVQTFFERKGINVSRLHGKNALPENDQEPVEGDVSSDHSVSIEEENEDREVDPSLPTSLGDLVHADMGQGIAFRPGTFDGAVSISALQWLCYAYKKSHHPRQRLSRLFERLYMALRQGGRAVFQIYPEHPDQLELMTTCAMKSGFTGGVVVDFPHSAQAKKYFLVLFAGTFVQSLPAAKMSAEEEENEHVVYSENRFHPRTPSVQASSFLHGKKRIPLSHPVKYSKAWILSKKEQMRKKGRVVAHDSQYTGRKRKSRRI